MSEFAAYQDLVNRHEEAAILIKQIFGLNKELRTLLSGESKEALLEKLLEQRELAFKVCYHAFKLGDLNKATLFSEFQTSVDTILDEIDPHGVSPVAYCDCSKIVELMRIHADLQIVNKGAQSLKSLDDDFTSDSSDKDVYRPKASLRQEVDKFDNQINQAKEELARKKLDQLKKKIKCYYQLGKWSAVCLGVTGLAALGAKYGIIPTDKIGVKSYAVAGVVFGIGTGVGIGKNCQYLREYKRIGESTISQEDALRYIENKRTHSV